jgi:Protein of unknown function (DUF3237)
MTDSSRMTETVISSEPIGTDGPRSSLNVSHELTMRVVLAQPPQFVGAGPLGVRVVGGVATGTVTGPRINGTIVGPGADWMLIGPDGFGRVDVRLQIETDDGAVVFLRYEGLIELNAVSSAALMDAAAETTWDEQYFRTAPRFETGDDRYAWLNRTTFVARGRVTRDGLEYDVFRVD